MGGIHEVGHSRLSVIPLPLGLLLVCGRIVTADFDAALVGSTARWLWPPAVVELCNVDISARHK